MIKASVNMFHEIEASLKLTPAWSYLGWQDVKLKYRRSTLGPWWITISMAMFITMMTIVYTRIFHQNIHTYMPFFAAGFLLWSLVTSTITDSTEVLMSSQNMIKQNPLPNMMYIFRMMYKNIIIFLHNFAVYIIVVFASQAWPNLNTFYFIPGLLLMLINLTWVSTLVAFISTRYRDIPPIILTAIQILFLVSPITWMPGLVGKGHIMIAVNPVYYLMDTVRSPLLGHAPMLRSWLLMGTIAVLGWGFMALLYKKYQHRVAFWVG